MLNTRLQRQDVGVDPRHGSFQHQIAGCRRIAGGEMRQAHGRQRAAERTRQGGQRRHRRQCGEPALAEHSRALLGFHFRALALAVPAMVAGRHDQNLARRAGRIGLANFILGGFHLGRFRFVGFGLFSFHLGRLDRSSLPGRQAGSFDLFRRCGRHSLALRVRGNGSVRPGAEGAGFTAGLVGFMFAHGQILQSRLTIW